MKTTDTLDSAGLFLIQVLIRFAVAIDDWLLRRRRRRHRLLGSLRKLLRIFLERNGLAAPEPPFPRRGWRRTPRRIEEKVLRLHVEQPRLGHGQLRHLLYRVTGHKLCRETLRRIILRCPTEIAQLEVAKKLAARRHIVVKRPRALWGADLTLVWVLGFFPVWVFAAVDYFGSRVVVFEPILLPTSAQVIRVLERAFAEHGAPDRLLTDRGSVFCSSAAERFYADHDVEHTKTRAAHPWTNGRVERLFGTYKKTVRELFWLVPSHRQLRRICSDFQTWHNRDRPHQSNGGLTPDEVFRGRIRPARALGRISYFEGRLEWWRLA